MTPEREAVGLPIRRRQGENLLRAWAQEEGSSDALEEIAKLNLFVL